MGIYASNAGKSGGEFFTPQEVSELLTKITLVGKTEVNKVYDPAVGSYVIIVLVVKSLIKSRVLVLLQTIKTLDTIIYVLFRII